MISVPQKYITGSISGSQVCYFIALDMVSGSTPYRVYMSNTYLVSGSGAPVEVTYSGSVVTNIAHKYLASMIDNNGTVSTLPGIGGTDRQMKIDCVGTISSTNEMMLVLLNQERFDTDHIYEIENRDISVWQGFLPTSGSVITGSININTDFIPIFTGKTVDVGDYDYGTFYIKCVSSIDRDAELIPKKMLTPSEYPSLLPENYFKPKPITLGDFSSSFNEYLVVPDGMRCLQVDRVGQRFVFNDETASNVGKPIYYPADGVIAVLTSSYDYNVTASTQLTLNGKAYGDFYIKPVVYRSGSVTPQNLDDAYDDSWSTYTTVRGTTGWYQSMFGNTMNYGYVIGKASEDPRAMDVTASVMIYVSASGLTGIAPSIGIGHKDAEEWASKYFTGSISDGGNSVLKFYSASFVGDNGWEQITKQFTEVSAKANAKNPVGAGFSDIGNLVWRVRSEIDGLTTNVDYTSIAAVSTPMYTGTGPQGATVVKPATNKPASGYSTQTITSNYAVNNNLFVPGYGYKFTGEMTESRAHGYTTNDVIQNPAYVIEYLLHHVLDIPYTRIDTASFDVVGNASSGSRNGWKMAVNVFERESSIDVISKICQQAATALILDTNDKYRLVSIGDTTGSVAWTMTTGSIATVNGIPQINVGMTGGDLIYNDIKVNYGFYTATGAFTKTLYISDTNGDGILDYNWTDYDDPIRGANYLYWFNESVAKYGATQNFNLDATYIRDSATALKLSKKIADYHCFKRLTMVVDVIADKDTMALQLGDLIKVDIDLLDTAHRETATWMIAGIRMPEVSTETYKAITLELQEMPNEYVGESVIINRYISSDDIVSYS